MTSQVERTALAVVHNVTAATRLFDVLPILADDPRVQVHFSCPDSSPFRGQIAEYLTERAITPISWKTALETRFDLAISASHGGSLHEIKAPLIVLPHGMGYNKYLVAKTETETENRDRFPVFGLAPEWLTHDGEVIASSLLLSHPEQLDRLATSCPQAAEVAFVAGDPSFDRILASLPLRHLYREALGVRQRLVLVSSTWGAQSLYGRQPDLVRRLRAELPLDDYAVAVALHPNVWSAHTPWQVRRWLDASVRSGVIVFPAHEGWRAGLVAADLVIGDHGSVTFYGAALGTPVLLAEAPHETVDPASAVGRFLRAAGRLEKGPLRPQIESALSSGPDAAVTEIAALATSVPLESFALLRTELYRLLDLPEPEHPAEPNALPLPESDQRQATVQEVRVELEQHAEVLRATVVRFAATRGRAPARNAHLVVRTDEPSSTALQLADVVVHELPGDAGWITEILKALPGASLAARPVDEKTWVMGTRDEQVRLENGGPVLASVALAWIARGNELGTLPARIEVTAG